MAGTAKVLRRYVSLARFIRSLATESKTAGRKRPYLRASTAREGTCTATIAAFVASHRGSHGQGGPLANPR
jgi:hypothetical protein